MGHELKSAGFLSSKLSKTWFRIKLKFRNKKWVITEGAEMPKKIENEMYRQFAAYKARYLAEKEKLKNSPRGVSGKS
jgi:hypothetical protein